MSDGPVPDWPHKPAPPEERRLLPEWPMLSRGLGLLGGGVVSAAGAVAAVRWHWLAGAVLSPPLVIVAGLFAWAAAIHLTGGEKFDDHPWV